MAGYGGGMPERESGGTSSRGREEVLEVAGRTVTVSNPGKVFFPRTGHTKLDLVRYYLSVADGALRAVGGRPMVLKRFVNGAEGEAFFQKRAPSSRPDWIETITLSFPSGRTADEVVVRDPAGLAWVVNLGCIDLNPHPVLAADLDHPDELRVDLDPVPGVGWPQIREVALVARQVLADFGLTGWPKTSGSRGFHIYARIQPRWTFTQVRRAAVALAREVERRAPELATSKWWKEERHGVFVDYNQNAKDRTVASAYSVRPTADGRVSAPLTWDEVPDCDPADFTIDTFPARFARVGDLWAGMDASAGPLDALLEQADRDEAAGLPDAPWPPHYDKQAGEPPRVQPSKRRASPDGGAQRRATPNGGAQRPAVPPPAPGKDSGPTGRRRSSIPLIEIARAATQAEAMAGLERWKQRHPGAWAYLEPRDVLVDSMRGRYTTWTRIRLNLRNVPAGERPPQEALEVDYDPWDRGVARLCRDVPLRDHALGCDPDRRRSRGRTGPHGAIGVRKENGCALGSRPGPSTRAGRRCATSGWPPTTSRCWSRRGTGITFIRSPATTPGRTWRAGRCSPRWRRPPGGSGSAARSPA
jgi:bifunctional non-homologous end joining protein LigD